MIPEFAAIIAARRPGRWLRFRADLVSLAYLALAAAALAGHWLHGEVVWWLVPVHAAMAYGMGCIQHDHCHLPMWRTRWLNRITDLWLAVLRGDGPWSWMPTHVRNHHRFANRIGDLTLTWRYGRGSGAATWARYTIDAQLRYAGACLVELVRCARRGRWWCWAQCGAAAAVHGAALWSDPWLALWVLIVPQAFGIVAMVGTGFHQHQGTDPRSPWRQARDFTGRLNNWLHFNHGLHTVHHAEPGLHWSEWPAAHRAIADRLDPGLQHACLPWYLLRASLIDAWSAGRRTGSGDRAWPEPSIPAPIHVERP